MSDTARMLEYGEARAAIDFFRAVPPDLATTVGLQVKAFGSTVVFTAKALPMILYNRVLCLGIVEPVTQEIISELVSYLRQHAAPNFAFQISPAAPVLSTWLTEHGLKRTNSWMKLYRGTDPPLPMLTSLRVEEAGTEQASVFANTFCEGYGISAQVARQLVAPLVGRTDWHCYLALEGDVPAATGALFVQDGIGWLGFSSTLPAYRRRGAQSALITRRIQDAAAQGCQWLVTETDEHTSKKPNQSYLNLIRLGFRLAYQRPNYEVET